MQKKKGRNRPLKTQTSIKLVQKKIYIEKMYSKHTRPSKQVLKHTTLIFQKGNGKETCLLFVHGSN